MYHFDSQTIFRLQQARKLAFPDFDQIRLTPAAMQIVCNLFLNPDCRTDINLELFVNKSDVKLKDVAEHIITAAPVSLAAYARDANKIRLTRQDIIKCFTENHVHAVAANHIESRKSASYACAHVMMVGRVVRIRSHGDRLVDIRVPFRGQSIFLQNVTVPDYLKISVGDTAWHHFGSIIDVVQSNKDKQLAGANYAYQLNTQYMHEIATHIEVQNIDFSNQQLFKKDIVHAVWQEKKNRLQLQRNDLEKKLNFGEGNMLNNQILFNA